MPTWLPRCDGPAPKEIHYMKTRNLFLTLLGVTVLLSVTVLFSLAASAQVVIHGGDSLTGTVSSAHGPRIGILDDRIVFNAADATVVSPRGPAKLSDVKKGDRITAQIAGTIDGELHAGGVLILDDPDAALSGAVEAIDAAAGLVTLFGQEVRVTASTIFRGLHGEPLSGLGAVVRGQQVTVHLDAAQAGLVARALMISSPAPFYPTELEGTIESIHNDLWTIVAPNARITVRVTSDTTIVGTPRVGDLVFVTFRTGSDGLKVAITIAPANSTPEPTFDVRGKVAAIGQTALTLTNDAGDDTLDVTLDGNTVFTPGRPAVGDRVVVSMYRLPDDTLLATRVARDTTASTLTSRGPIQHDRRQ
jgi:hypothetical protein